MPRHPSEDLMVPWKLHIPARLAGALEFQLLDPITGRSKYGARSKLIAELIEKWLEDQKGNS